MQERQEIPSPADAASSVPCRAGQNTRMLLLGAAVDQDTLDLLIGVDRIPQVQTYRFQWALIHAIEHALGREIDVVSTVPTRDYPYTRKIWFGPRRRPRGSGMFRQMSMVNLLGFKQLGRLITASWELLKWMASHRDGVVVNYGVIVPHLMPAILLAPLFRNRVVGVLTDPPLTYHDEGLVRRLARSVDAWLLKRLLTRLDGVIALTKSLADRFAPGVPSLVMEGIISDDVAKQAASAQTADLPGDTHERPFTIMYAGQLHADYGVKVLLDAFAQLQGSAYELWLFGQGTMEEEIRKAARHDTRIRYQGWCGPDVLFPRMRQADVMVVPRFTNDRIAEYSFPSKLLEYIAMGKIVISAKLPSIPPEYFPHLVLAASITPESLAEAVTTVAGWSQPERHRRQSEAQAFAFEYKTQACQGRRIAEFLSQIAAPVSC